MGSRPERNPLHQSLYYYVRMPDHIEQNFIHPPAASEERKHNALGLFFKSKTGKIGS